MMVSTKRNIVCKHTRPQIYFSSDIIVISVIFSIHLYILCFYAKVVVFHYFLFNILTSFFLILAIMTGVLTC